MITRHSLEALMKFVEYPYFDYEVKGKTKGQKISYSISKMRRMSQKINSGCVKAWMFINRDMINDKISFAKL